MPSIFSKSSTGIGLLKEIPGCSRFSKRGDGIDFELAQGGKRHLSLKDVLDRETALDWVTSRLRARGIPELPAEKLPGGQRGTDESERNQQLVLGKD